MTSMALHSGARCSGALLQALSASNPLPLLASHSTLAGLLQQPSAVSPGTSRLFSDLAKPRDDEVVEYKGPFGPAVGRVKVRAGVCCWVCTREGGAGQPCRAGGPLPPWPGTSTATAAPHTPSTAPPLHRLQKLSLFSCACALAAGPVIFGLDASSTLTAKASIAGTLATFGVFTTGLLQWFTGEGGCFLHHHQGVVLSGPVGAAGCQCWAAVVAAGCCWLELYPGLAARTCTGCTTPAGSNSRFNQCLLCTGPYVQHLTWDPDTDTVEVTTLNLMARPQTQRFHVAEAQPADTVHPLSSFKVRSCKPLCRWEQGATLALAPCLLVPCQPATLSNALFPFRWHICLQ